MVTEIIIIISLIILNGILSASEIAIVSSRKARLQAAAQNNAGAKKALKLKDSPNQFLSTVQIGITLIGILTGLFSGGTISSYLDSILNTVPFLAPYSTSISIAVVVICITYLSLVVGELVPKRIGMAIPEKYASFIAIPMDTLSKVVKPFVWALSVSTDFIVRLLNIKVSKNTVTEEEIKALVDEGVDSGAIENYEHDMVDRILSMGDKRAINLMIHRSNIVYLDLQDSIEDIRKNIIKYGHTEYPVCDGNFDHIKGIIHSKTLLKAFLSQKEVILNNLIQPIPFVNENSSVYNVLEVLKNNKVLQAVVIDEYGSPQGIITGKEIMSALVGGFDENSDNKTNTLRLREDGSYIIDGRYQLDDFFEKFEIGLSEEDEEAIGNITTIAGLVFLLLDHIPIEGETVIYKGHKLEVIDMDGNRIDKIAINILDPSPDDETEYID